MKAKRYCDAGACLAEAHLVAGFTTTRFEKATTAACSKEHAQEIEQGPFFQGAPLTWKQHGPQPEPEIPKEQAVYEDRSMRLDQW